MRVTIASGSLFSGLAIIGTGIAVTFPDQRWIALPIVRPFEGSADDFPLLGIQKLVFEGAQERSVRTRALSMGREEALNGQMQL